MRYQTTGGGFGGGGSALGGGNLLPGTRGLLVATMVCSFYQGLIGFPGFVLELVAIAQLKYPWTLFTSAVFDGHGSMPGVVTALMLWMFGNRIEQILGTRKFVGLYLIANAVGILGASAVLTLRYGAPFDLALQMTGTMPGGLYGITALFVAFGHFHRNATVMFMFILPVNAWNLVFYGMGLEAVIYLLKAPPTVPGSLAVALVTLAYFTRGQRAGFGPLGKLQKQANDAYDRWRFRRKTAHLKVLKGGKDDPFRRDDDPEKPVIH